MNVKEYYDIVIIGSGLGGLECGVMLSKEGYNVCILEQSPIYGGCLQSFSRKGVKIDTGIHYIGSMDEGQIMRQYLKYFGVFDQLSVVKLDQDFDIINMNGTGEFNLNQGYDNFRSYLTEMFPTERNGIFRYCRKLNEIGSSISVDIHKKGLLSSGINDNLNLSASEFINECVSDKILQNLLAGTNLLYAGVRESSNLYHHAMINHSNIEGSYRIVGSTQTLADLLVKQIQNYGGTVLNNSCVANIHTEGMKVEYVELTNSERIYGKHFISNIHPRKTLDMIATTPVIKKAYRTRFNLLPNTYGLFSVYLLMKPGSMPYQNKNFYYFDSDDVWDTTIQKPDYKVKSVMLSNQLHQKDENHTDVITLISPVDLSVFDRWSNIPKNERGKEYDELKTKITNNIIEFTLQFKPELKGCINHVYSASPLTYENYTGTPNGSAYGLLKDYRNSIATLLPVRTKFNNLYLTGQNINVHGALGVTLTSADTCSVFLGAEYLAKRIGGA